MLDFYEGELLRRTVLVRNALRRAAKEGSVSDAELFFGAASAPTRTDISDALDTSDNDESRVLVQVEDYDYGVDDEDYDEDDDQEIVSRVLIDTPTVSTERVWFDDLFEEVGIEQESSEVIGAKNAPVVSLTNAQHQRAQKQKSNKTHPADREVYHSSPPCPSLIDDEGSSTDESDDDQENETILDRTTSSLEYSGGAPLSLSTTRKSNSTRPSYHDRIYKSRHSLSTVRPTVVSY